MRRILASASAIGVLAVPAAAAAPFPADTDNFIEITGSPADIALLRQDAAEQAREARRKRAALRKRRTSKARASTRTASVPPHLAAIAACESGGNPRAIGGGGAFRGKYQFSVATWQSVGGQGDPAAAPESEQDRRAAMLYAKAGAGQWPVCGR